MSYSRKDYNQSPESKGQHMKQKKKKNKKKRNEFEHTSDELISGPQRSFLLLV